MNMETNDMSGQVESRDSDCFSHFWKKFNQIWGVTNRRKVSNKRIYESSIKMHIPLRTTQAKIDRKRLCLSLFMRALRLLKSRST